jgi:hypothetical protein
VDDPRECRRDRLDRKFLMRVLAEVQRGQEVTTPSARGIVRVLDYRKCRFLAPGVAGS